MSYNSNNNNNNNLRCGACRAVVTESAERDIMFFIKSDTEVHIAIKPERVVLARKETSIKFVPVIVSPPPPTQPGSGSTTTTTPTAPAAAAPQKKKNKRKIESLVCCNCETNLGGVCRGVVAADSNGGGADLVSFARDAVELCGVPPIKKTRSKKAPKFAVIVREQSEWREIERRSEEEFIPGVTATGTSAAVTGNEDETPPTVFQRYFGGIFKTGQNTWPSTTSSSSSSSTPTVPRPPQPQQKRSQHHIISPLIPETPLNIPQFPVNWLSRNFFAPSSDNEAYLEQIDKSFGWVYAEDEDVSGRSYPREYQIQCVIECLLRDLIVVLPTGAGKTLVAAHVIRRLKYMNPDYMALFIVDRVPLVFQQAHYLVCQTGLRVCPLCSENVGTLKVLSLNESKYDVLVITAGCLKNLLETGKLDLGKQFCCVVFDECHHAIGRHVYCDILDRLDSVGLTVRPRIIGLTASPMSANGIDSAKIRLNKLCDKFGPNAGVFYPEVPSNPVLLQCKIVNRSSEQKKFARKVIPHMKAFVKALNLLLETWNLGASDTTEALITLGRCDDDDDLDYFLSPSTMGHLRGQLNACIFLSFVSEEGYSDSALDTRNAVNFLAETLTSLIAALESSEVMGPVFGFKVIEELLIYHETSASPVILGISGGVIDALRRDFDSFRINVHGQTKHSQRLSLLTEELNNRKTNQDSRVLILVHTRDVARQLTEFLCGDEAVQSAFRPQMVVGHGGFDGMSWFTEQAPALDSFRDTGNSSSCRLLIATSVLEEGLDVAKCDLIVCLQGVQSLIGFIQSRGRARKRDSQMVVLVSSREKERLDIVRQQEVKMKLVVQKHSKLKGLPSVSAMKIQDLLKKKYQEEGVNVIERSIQEITTGNLSWFAAPLGRSAAAGREIVFRLIFPNSPAIDQESLEHDICSVFAPYEDSPLFLSSIVPLNKVAAADCIFEYDQYQGFLVGLASSENSHNQTGDQHLWALFDCVSSGWDFRMRCSTGSGPPCWIQRCDIAGKKTESILQLESHSSKCQISFGRWGGPNTFIMRHQIPPNDITNIIFHKKEGLEVMLHGDNFIGTLLYSIHVHQAIISGFCLVSIDSTHVHLFIPLASAPSVVQQEIGTLSETESRVTAYDHHNFPHVKPISINDVMCLSFPKTAEFCEHLPGHKRRTRLVSRILMLPLEFFAVPMFETRIGFLDQTNVAGIESEFAYVSQDTDSSLTTVTDGHCNELPGLDNSQYVLSDALWLLLSAFSRRLGCFTDEARRFLLEFIIDVSIEGESCKMSSLLYALQECIGLEVPYWADIRNRFMTSFRADGSAVEGGERMGISIKARGDSRRDSSNWFKVYRAVSTPTRVIYQPPISVKGSRLYRAFSSERFVTVAFRDEQLQPLYGEEMIFPVRYRIATGLRFAGRDTVFFGGSNSQIRQQQLLFVDVTTLPTGVEGSDDVNARLSLLRDQVLSPQWVNQLHQRPNNKIKNRMAAKYLSTLALFCTADTPTVVVDNSQVLRVPDVKVQIPNVKRSVVGTDLTDGVGLICQSMAQKISKEYLKIHYVPTALQIRWRGAKGVVIVVPDDSLSGKKMLIRPSMEKCFTGTADDGSVGIVGQSKYLPLYLNREIITLLTSVPVIEGHPYVPLEALQDLLGAALKKESTIFHDISAAGAVLGSGRIVPEVKETFVKLSRHINPMQQPLFVDMLRVHYKFTIRDLVKKTRIPLDNACLLMGIADPFGVLKDGEIFVQVDQKERSEDADEDDGGSFVLRQEEVAIWRNPCLHPGDVRVVSAVDYPQLHQFRNVVVFPCSEKVSRNLPLECSGGDLDGDLFAVLWDQRLVPPIATEEQSLPYHEFGGAGSNDVSSDDADFEDEDRFSNAALARFLGQVFSTDLLGRIATMHLALCDIQENGARDPIACKVSKAQSYAVDFPKTGIPPLVPKKAQDIVRDIGYPDFMRKREKLSYTSTKALGFLYRRAASFEFGFSGEAQSSTSTSSSLALFDPRLFPGRAEKYFSDARRLHGWYWGSLRGLMISYGLKSEAECIFGRALSWHPMIHDYGKAQETIQRHVGALLRELKEQFQLLYGVLEQREKWKVACVWYQVSHKDGRAKSFSIVLSDLLAEYLNTTKNVPPDCLTNCYAGVGKELLDYCGEMQPRISEWRSTKLVVLQSLKRALEDGGLPASLFNLRAYGSVALGLCDVASDLDVCVDFDLATLNVLSLWNINSIEEFYSTFSKAEREEQLLSLLVSPRLEPVCLLKREVFSAKVPVLRCEVSSLVELEGDRVPVDVTCCTIGIWKAKWLQASFSDPSLYFAFLILLKWAREAELVGRTENHQRDNNAVEASSDDRGRCTALFAAGEFHALIMYLLRDELKPVTIEDDVDFSPPSVSSADAERTGFFVLNFFEKAQKVGSDIHFVWPVESQLLSSSPLSSLDPDTRSLLTTSIELSRITKLIPLCEPARHCLLTGATAKQLFDMAAGDAEVGQISQKLSMALSCRIGRATTFHSCRLSELSGCLVEIHEVSNQSQLLLQAEGSRRCISRLKDELSKCSRIANRWGGRVTTRAARYFMEEASELRMLNVVDTLNGADADVQLKFPPLTGTVTGGKNIASDGALNRLLKTSMNENSVCRSVGRDSQCAPNACSPPNPFSTPFGSGWPYQLPPRDLALVRSLANMLTRQISSMPDNVPDKFESIKLRLLFGHFLVVNISNALPASRKTLSTKDLLSGMKKVGKARTNWDRGDPTRHVPEQPDSRKKEYPGIELPRGNCGAASNRRKKKGGVHKKRMLMPGIRTTFIPTFSNVEGLYQIFARALTACGYYKNDETNFSHRVDYSISMAVSKGYEVRADFEGSAEDSSLPPRAISVSERPLNWIHYTFLGNGVLPDARLKLQTTTRISEDLKRTALGNNDGYSPILWKKKPASDTATTPSSSDSNVTPCFSQESPKELQRKLLYIRHRTDHTEYKKHVSSQGPSPEDSSSFTVTARVTIAREFLRVDDELMLDNPVEKVELALEFDFHKVYDLIRDGAYARVEEFACGILREMIDIGQELRIRGVHFT